MYDKALVHVRGIVPTIHHNGQLADPMNKWTRAIKEITGKRKKTDDDYVELAKLEWFGSLYLDDAGHPCWPGESIEAMLKAAARTRKQGKDVERGITCMDNAPLIYEGPKDPDKMWECGKYRHTCSVVNPSSRGRVMRTRPIFHAWELKFTIDFDTEQLNKSDVIQFCEIAGKIIGLSDGRPRYGRFEVVTAA